MAVTADGTQFSGEVRVRKRIFASDDGALGAPSGGVTLGDATTSGTLAGPGFSTARTITLEAGGGTIRTAGRNATARAATPTAAIFMVFLT